MAIYFFDKNQTLIKIVPESATFEAIQTQELDDDSLLKDTLSVTIKGDEKLISAEYMAVKSYKGNAQTFDMYRIVTDTTPDKSMSFTGMSLAPYELNGRILQDLRPANHSLSYTLNRILTGTDWRVGYIEDGLSNVTTTFYYVSVKEALKELQSLVGCEFVFKVEISGQKITDKWIEVYSEMGNRTKKRFNYGTNALTVVRETNKVDIYTALIGRGKGEEVSSGEDNASGQAGYGRKITFEDIEWKKSSGKPLDKPKGQYYLELPQATQVYGIKNIDGTMKARVGIVDFDDEEDKNRLINLTYQQLLVSSRPKVLFKTTVANIGATGIGDTVTIHRHDLNIHYQTRVRKIVRNKLNDNKTQIELGDAVVTPSTKRAKQNNATIKNLNQEIEKVKTDVIISQTSADGKNTINYGSTEPERKRTGDTWYRPHPSIAGETQMLVWNGNVWELVLDSSDLASVSREVENAISKAEDAQALAVSEAERTLAQAKADATAKANAVKEEISGAVNTAISTAEDAQALAVSEAENALALAKADATAKVNAIHGQISGEVNNAIETAESAKLLAVSEAESALAQAKADATAKANAVKEEVGNSVNAAINTANDAKQAAIDNYANAVAEAERLVGEQTTAFDTKFGEIEGSVSDVAAKADEAVNEINTAIQNAGFTSLDETIQNMNYITMNAEQNAQQAITDASNAYGLAQNSISEAQTAQANSLAALGKADNALGGVSNLDVRVDDVEAELKLKADNTFMNEDGTLTTLSNAITFNAHKFSSDMSRIESRVESLAGEINLVILKDAHVGKVIRGTDIYPNPTENATDRDTMRSLIEVSPNEQLAFSKKAGSGWARIHQYDKSYNNIQYLSFQDGKRLVTILPNAKYIWISYPRGSQPQLIRGTEFLPYRPNLVDQMTSDEVVLFRNEYDEFADRTERRMTAIDSSGGRLEVAEALITQTASGLQTTVGKVDSQESRLSTVEQTANGLQSTVADKASQSQVTQLANGLNSVVESLPASLIPDGNNLTNGKWGGWLTDLSISFNRSINKKTELFVGKQGTRIWYPSLKVGVGKKYKITFDMRTNQSGRKVSVGGWEPAEHRIGISSTSQSYEVVFEPRSTNDFSIYFYDTGTYEIGNVRVFETRLISETQISQLANNINLKVSNADLLSQINVQAGGVLITSGTNKLNITPTTTFIQDATIKSAMIDTIDVNKLTGITADFTTMITKGLTADVITSTMIRADDAMFSKLFATSMATDKLVAQGAWIKSANIVSLDADKIKSGTIDSARIDAGYIVTNGLSTNVVKSEHINATVALVNKIFSEEAYINALTSKTIFARNIKAIEIDASKITSGELDAARIKSKDVVTQGLTTNVVKSEHINATVALVNKIFSEEAYINALTSKTIFARNIKAIEIDASKITTGELAAARIKSKDVVTAGLSADVVQATHIKAEAGLVGKLFSTTAYIEELTNKTVFTEKIQAINIIADKVTTGTLDASKVKVVNLDANNITANKTSFIQSNWNDIESSIRIDGRGLLSTASDGSQVYLQNGIVGARNPSGATIGQIGYAYESSSPWYSMQVSHGSHFQIRMSRGDGQLNKQAFYIISGGTESYLNTDNIYLNPASTGRVRVQGAMTVDKDLRLEGAILVRSRLEYLNGGYIESQAANSNILINATNKLIIYTNGTNALEFDANNAVFRRKISDNSDIRLKTNIVDMPINSLEAIRNIEIKKFDYLDGRKDYYGIIAQQAQNYLPELINTDSNGYLMVDKSAMTYVNMHAIQQLNSKVDDEITQLKAQIASLQKELSLLKGD